MRKSCTYGSVRGAPSNGRPYRDRRESHHSRRRSGAGPLVAGAEAGDAGDWISQQPVSVEAKIEIPIRLARLAGGPAPSIAAVLLACRPFVTLSQLSRMR